MAVIAGEEARAGEGGLTPRWAALGGSVAGVGSFTGWALGVWLDIPAGNLLWLVSSIAMCAWTLWLGVALAGRSPTTP